MPQPPLPFACALGQSDRSTCHWQVAQAVLWLPGFGGGAGVQRRQAVKGAPARAGAAEFTTVGTAPTALALRLRSREIGPINLPLADCSDGPSAPGFRGRCGRSEATGSSRVSPRPPWQLFPRCRRTTARPVRPAPRTCAAAPSRWLADTGQAPVFPELPAADGRRRCHR